MSEIVEAEVRALVRETLLQVLPALGQPQRSPAPRKVELRSDADLAAFVNTVLDIARDPSGHSDLRSGRISFTLDGAAAAGSVSGDETHGAAGRDSRGWPAPPQAQRVEQGAVTEKMIVQAADSGAYLILGKRAVLTPLARECARKRGVRIERAT